MTENKQIFKFDTNVKIEVIDAQGNIERSVEDHNAETLWAKINTPVSGTLYLDLITKDVNTVYNMSLSDISKTAHLELSNIRGNILSSAFTLTGTSYSVSFSWYNNTGTTVLVYGLLSYNTTNVYSIFDTSSNPIAVLSGSTVIGTYKITYDAATPVLTTNTINSNSVSNRNIIYCGLREDIPDSVKAYKLSRVFTKTSVYQGSNVADTLFTSDMTVNATYVNNSFSDFFNNYTGEIYYKCLTSGNPGGALVNRFATMPVIRTYQYSHTGVGLDSGNPTMEVLSNVPYIISSIYAAPATGDQFGLADQWWYGYTQTIYANNDSDVSIKPYKMVYIANTANVESSLNTTIMKYSSYLPEPYSDSNSYDILNCAVEMFTHNGSNYQHVQIMYWEDAPTLVMYTYGGITLKAYINNTWFTATKTTVSGWEKHVFNLSALPSSGSDVLVLYGTGFNKHTLMCTNMYSYVVPYAGMFTDGSSEITSGWVSPSCFNMNGVDTVMTVINSSEPDKATIDVVTNMNLATAINDANYQYSVSVTAGNAEKIAGIIKKNNKGKVICWHHSSGYAYANSNNTYGMITPALPYYITDNNFVHFAHGAYIWDSNYYYVGGNLLDHGYHVNPGYVRALYNTVCNNSITITPGVVPTLTYINAKPFIYDSPNGQMTDLKLLIFKEQGVSNYQYAIPNHLSSYSEGTTSIAWGGKTYEFETTLQTTETIGKIQLNIDVASVFAVNEYFSLPFCSNNVLAIDSLETWQINLSNNIPVNNYDASINDITVSADELVDSTITTYTDQNIQYANTGELTECEVCLPDPLIQVEGNNTYTHVLTFTVSWNTDPLQYPAIHIPKKITVEGVEYLTNVDSTYVTDGLHVIPWSLNSDCAQLPKLLKTVGTTTWELVLNRTTLQQLYPDTHSSVIVHAYVQAKQKSQWLPMDIDVKSIINPKYVDNNGRHTLLLINSSDTHGSTTVSNSASIQSSLSVVTSGASVYHSTDVTKFSDSSIFISDAASSIKLSSNNENGLSINSNTNATLDFWIFPTSIASERTLVSSYHDTDYYVDYQYGWYLCLTTTGYLYLRFRDNTGIHSTPAGYGGYGDNYIYFNTNPTPYISINNWYHIALVVKDGYVHIYVDGTCVGYGPFTAYTGVRGLTFFSNYIGYVDGIHLTDKPIWIDEFQPPSYPWGSPELDEEGVRYKSTAVLPVTLPVAFDPKVDIINSESTNPVTFLQANPYNFKTVNDELSNRFYVKVSDIELLGRDDTKISYIKMPVRSRNTYAYGGGITGFYMTVENKTLTSRGDRSMMSFVNDITPYRTNVLSSVGAVNGILISNAYESLKYKYTDIIALNDENNSSLQLITSGTAKSVDPEDIFLRFITPDTFSSHITYNYNKTVTKNYDYTTINHIDNNSRIEFANAFDQRIFSNLVFEVIASKPGFMVYRQGYTNFGFEDHTLYLYSDNELMHRYNVYISAFPLLRCAFNSGNNLATTRHFSQCYKEYPFMFHNDANNVTHKNLNGLSNYASIAQYQVPTTISTETMLKLFSHEPGVLTYTHLDSVSGTDILDIYRKTFTAINGVLIDMTQLSSTPNKYLYTTNKSIIPGETSVFNIENNSIVSANTIDIITYVPAGYTYKYTPYVNTVGTHILSSTSATLSYELVLSNKFMNADHRSYKYGYTYNPELISILNTNSLTIPLTTGYVPNDTVDDGIILKGSSYSLTPTNVLLFEMPIFGHRQIALGSLVGSEKHQITAFKDIYTNSENSIFSEFMDNIRTVNYVIDTFQSHNWVDRSINTINSGVGVSFLQYPYFNNYNIDELYSNKKYGCVAWNLSTSQDIVGNTASPVYYTLSSGTQVYKTGVINNDALLIDSRVIVKNNIKHNLIFDTNSIPVTAIDRLGKFSIHTYTDEYGVDTFKYVPLVKITNTSNSTSAVFALHNIYNNPVDITTILDNITDATMQKFIIDRYIYNSSSYEAFNTLLNDYTTSNYQLSIGILIYVEILGNLCVFKGMSAQIMFNDATKYSRPEWCYVNNKLNLKIAAKNDIEGSISTYKVKVYNNNDTTVTDYSMRLDVSKYDLSGFNNGIVAVQGASNIPTLYEVDDDGRVSNVYNDFNDKGIWVKIPTITANSVTELTLTNTNNSYTVEDIFTVYEGFDSLNTADWVFSRNYDATVTGTDYDGGVGNESYSQRISLLSHNLSIGIVDNSLRMMGQETTSIVSVASNLPNDSLYEILYKDSTNSNLEIGFGNISGISSTAVLPYYNENTHTNYSFVKTDLHKGDNYIYVYYTSGTATDSSNTSIFNSFQDFSNTAVPGWYKYNAGNMTISSGSMNITNANARLQSLNCLSSMHSYGYITQIAASSTNASALISTMYTNDHTINSLACGKFSSVRYLGDYIETSHGAGCSLPTAAQSMYLVENYGDRVYIEKDTTKTQQGKYYLLGNARGSMMRQNSNNSHFVLGGGWSNADINGSYTVNMTYSLVGMYKAPSSLYITSYGNEQTGSWTIDGHTFTKRKLVKLNCDSIDTDVIVKLDRTQFANLTALRFVSLTQLNKFSDNTDCVSISLGSENQSITSKVSVETELIPYWSSASDTENAFIKTDLCKGSNELYVYYTSGTATNLTSGSNVFDFYDDFASGTIDASKWHVTQGSGATGYVISVGQYQATLTPAHIRSNYLLCDNYTMMCRGSVNTTAAQNGIMGIWNSAVDFYGDFYSQSSNYVCTIGFPYNHTGSPHYGNAYSLTPATAFTTYFNKGVYKENYPETLVVYSTNDRIDTSFYGVAYASGYNSARPKYTTGDYTGNMRIGTSSHYSTSTAVAIDTRLNWVAAWQDSVVPYDYVWGAEESGSWTVDTHVFTNRKKLTIVADSSDNGVVISIKRAMFNNLSTIRIVRTIRRGHGLRYVDTHKTDTLLSFVPKNSDMFISRQLIEDRYEQSSSIKNININSDATGKLGITSSTGNDNEYVTIKWVRARKYYPEKIEQLRIEDTSLLIENMHSDWYLISTSTNVKPANVSNINTLIANNKLYNHDSVFLKEYVKFPCSDLVRNKHYGFGRHLSYRN